MTKKEEKTVGAYLQVTNIILETPICLREERTKQRVSTKDRKKRKFENIILKISRLGAKREAGKNVKLKYKKNVNNIQ